MNSIVPVLTPAVNALLVELLVRVTVIVWSVVSKLKGSVGSSVTLAPVLST